MSSSDCELNVAAGEVTSWSLHSHQDSDLLAERRRCLADCFRGLADNIETAAGVERSSELVTSISYMMHQFADIHPGPNDEMMQRMPRLAARSALANAMIVRELLLWISESAAYEPTVMERPPTIMAAVEMVLAEGEIMSSKLIRERAEVLLDQPISSVGTALHCLKQRGRADHVSRGRWQRVAVFEDRPPLPDDSMTGDAPADKNIQK